MKDRVESVPAGSNDSSRPVVASPEDREALVAGLLANPRRIPCRFFYDDTGSRLFERITALEEYYPTRTEKWILERHGADLMRGVEQTTLIEFGSGDCSKISILLGAMPGRVARTLTYVPLDVSRGALDSSRCDLRDRFPGVHVRPLVADFTRDIEVVARFERRVFLFLGSTIGNLDRDEARRFVARLAALMEPGERLFLGLDRVKDPDVIERAYNDAGGITARFNRNILLVANRIAGTDFDPDSFLHRAVYDRDLLRVEMSLVARRLLSVRLPGVEGGLSIRRGEAIFTESSHKFTTGHIHDLAAAGGLTIQAIHSDPKDWFSVVEFVKPPGSS